MALGPDATGVGWIYEYALVDRTGKHNLADLRALQDWTLKFELKTVPKWRSGQRRGWFASTKSYRIRLVCVALNITHAQLITAV